MKSSFDRILTAVMVLSILWSSLAMPVTASGAVDQPAPGTGPQAEEGEPLFPDEENVIRYPQVNAAPLRVNQEALTAVQTLLLSEFPPVEIPADAVGVYRTWENTGSTTINWISIYGDDPWLKLIPASLSIPPGGQATLNVFADRYGLNDGNHTSYVRLRRDTGIVDYFQVNMQAASFLQQGADFGCITSPENFTFEFEQDRYPIDFSWRFQYSPAWAKNYAPSQGVVPSGTGSQFIQVDLTIDPTGQAPGEKSDVLVWTTTAGHYLFPFLVTFGCGADTIPPAAVMDLSASSGSTSGTIDLTWTAPGDDGSVGQAAVYHIRYAEEAILSESEWSVATEIVNEPVPATSGTVQEVTVRGLSPDTRYWFVIRAEDEAGNLAGLSNNAGAAAGSQPFAYDLSVRDNLTDSYPCGLSGQIDLLTRPLVSTDIDFSVSHPEDISEVYLVISGRQTQRASLSWLATNTPGRYHWAFDISDMNREWLDVFRALLEVAMCIATHGASCTIGATISPLDLGDDNIRTQYGKLEQVVLVGKDGREYPLYTDMRINTIHDQTLIQTTPCDQGESTCFVSRCGFTFASGTPTSVAQYLQMNPPMFAVDTQSTNLSAPVNLLLSDSAGNKTGISALGEIFSDIPYSLFSGPLETGQWIVVYSPSTEEYKLDVNGTQTGNYDLLLFHDAKDDTRDRGFFIEGMGAEPNESSSYWIEVPDFKDRIPFVCKNCSNLSTTPVPFQNQPPNLPSDPSPLDRSTKQALDIQLTWQGGDPNGDAVFYDLYLEEGDSSPDQLLASGLTSSSYVPVSLKENTAYFWKIVATDEHGRNTSGPVWVFATSKETSNSPPFSPSSPSPADGSNGESVDVDLSWSGGDPDGDPVAYDVYLEAGDSSPDVQLSSYQSSLTFDPGTLAHDTTYYWQIVATDVHQVATPGPVWSFTTGPAPNAPPNPPFSPNPADGAVGQSVTSGLVWSTGGDPDGDVVAFDVYFEAGDSSPDVLVSSGLVTTLYNPPTLAYATTYYWQVIAVDEHGAQTPGPVWSFTTLGPPAGILFQETFTDGEITSNPAWTTTNNTASYAVINGELHSDGEDNDESDRYNAWYTTNPTYSASDYLELSYRGLLKSPGNPQAGRGIRMWAPGTDGRTYSLNIFNGYTNALTNEYCISLVYDTINSPHDLITTAFTPAYNQVYSVKAVRQSGVWSLYVDGNLIGSAADPLGLTNFANVYLITVGSIMVDDLLIRSTPSTALSRAGDLNLLP